MDVFLQEKCLEKFSKSQWQVVFVDEFERKLLEKRIQRVTAKFHINKFRLWLLWGHPVALLICHLPHPRIHPKNMNFRTNSRIWQLAGISPFCLSVFFRLRKHAIVIHDNQTGKSVLSIYNRCFKDRSISLLFMLAIAAWISSSSAVLMALTKLLRRIATVTCAL